MNNNNLEEDFDTFLTYLKKVNKITKMLPMTFILNHTHINYCEAIIDNQGLIGYVNPSHIKALIYESGLSEDEIYDLMPISEMPIYWLVEFTHCVSIWYDHEILPTNPTAAQINTIKLLKKHNIIE